MCSSEYPSGHEDSAIRPDGPNADLDNGARPSIHSVIPSGVVGTNLKIKRDDEIQEVASVGNVLNIDRATTGHPNRQQGRE